MTLDPRFLASISERGVLVPVVGYRDDAGQFVVLYGQRRTLAAALTKRESIPASIVERTGAARTRPTGSLTRWPRTTTAQP